MLLRVVAPFTVLATLVAGGCMEPQDVGLGPQCRSGLDTATQRLEWARARGMTGVVAYTKAAGLLSAAKIQQQFDEYQNCVLKVQQAGPYLDQLGAP